jgi:glyoxylase-like metal-dependent hydrolase (beta-lactamase superfamily II)
VSASEPLQRVAEVAHGIVRVLAPNPGLMTLDGTNTYICTAPSGTCVVDPGPAGDGHHERVLEVLDGGEVGAVVLTHMHGDHSAGAWTLAETLGCAVLRQLDGTLVEEQQLPGGLTVVATPGHTGDSVCLVSQAGPVLTGDTILGRGTAVVAHPDGVLGPYLASLERLQAFRGREVLPGHGPTLHDVAAVAEAYLGHRRIRLEAVRSALAAGVPADPEDVVPVVYAEVDRALWPAAALSVAAQLAYLAEVGQAR